jgi:hypothetical protein
VPHSHPPGKGELAAPNRAQQTPKIGSGAAQGTTEDDREKQQRIGQPKTKKLINVKEKRTKTKRHPRAQKNAQSHQKQARTPPTGAQCPKLKLEKRLPFFTKL